MQEIPELKDAKATKMEAYAISKRKPEERQVVKNALQDSSNKPETLRAFTRHEPRQPAESSGDYAYRYFKDAHRLLRDGIDWTTVSQSEHIQDLIQQEVFLRLAEACVKEHERIQETIRELRRETA